jgi:hypothetical protein
VRDDRLAAGDQRPDFLGRKAFILGHFGHLLGDNPFSRRFNLRHVEHTSGEFMAIKDQFYSMRKRLVTRDTRRGRSMSLSPRRPLGYASAPGELFQSHGTAYAAMVFHQEMASHAEYREIR